MPNVTPDEASTLTFFSSIPLAHRKEKWASGWKQWCEEEYAAQKMGRFTYGIIKALVGEEIIEEDEKISDSIECYYTPTGVTPEMMKNLLDYLNTK